MILRRTQSLCPVCLRRIDAVYERPDGPDVAEGGVFLRKTCPEHGAFSVPVWTAPAPAPGDAPEEAGAGSSSSPARTTPSTSSVSRRSTGSQGSEDEAAKR